MTENPNPKSQSAVLPYAWVILIVVFLASVAAPLNQSKIPPLMPVIMDTFQLTLGQAGWLMSVFALTGLFLSLPAGIFLQKFGPKILGLIALGCLSLGSAMGALSNNPSLLLFSRVIEGSGMGLIAVIAPAVIAMWFPPEKQGIPMGIWATWVPMGTVMVYSLAPGMSATFGWQSVWWLGAIFALVILLIYALLMRLPPWMAATSHTEVKTSIVVEFQTSLRMLNNRSIWLLGLVFGCFTLVFMGMGTFYPTFLAEERGYSLSQAAYISSIATIMVLFSAPLAGWLSDRIGSRRLMFSIPFLILSVVLFFPFKIVGWQIYAYMVLQGSFAGAIPTATFAAAPEVMRKPELAGLGMAVVMFGQNMGFFVGPILFGKLVESVGWVYAGYCLIPFCLLGFYIGWKLKVR